MVLLAGFGTEAMAQQGDLSEIDRLRAMLEAQQQLDAMRAELEAMRAHQAQQAVGERVEPLETDTAMAPAAQDREPVAAPTRGVVLLRREDGAQVTLSGQINQAMNIADDGESTDLYFVDNDVSGSRFRLAAAAPFGQATMGAVLEVGLSGNNSYEVSQDNQRADDVFTVRHADLRIRNDGWGQF